MITPEDKAEFFDGIWDAAIKLLDKEAAQLRASAPSPAAPGSQWQPIETAPNAPGHYIAHDAGHGTGVAYFDGSAWTDCFGFHRAPITHWMPLPEPPTPSTPQATEGGDATSTAQATQPQCRSQSAPYSSAPVASAAGATTESRANVGDSATAAIGPAGDDPASRLASGRTLAPSTSGRDAAQTSALGVTAGETAPTAGATAQGDGLELYAWNNGDYGPFERIPEAEAVIRAFDPVDDKDWDRLISFLDGSGHGQFWMRVLLGVRSSLYALDTRLGSRK